MRIERTGTVSPLTPRVKLFLTEALRGLDVDETHSHEDTRPDYLCLGGLLVVELKSLEEDGSTRMNNLTENLRQRDDWPEFLGSAPIQSFIKHTNDPDGLRRKVVQHIGRALINDLKKANRQIEAHKLRVPRTNLVGALVLVNENHEIYDPNIVAYVLNHALRRVEAGKPLYEHVDLVIYLTERHAQIAERKVAFPTLVVEGPGVITAPWKASVGDHFLRKWAEWNHIPLIDQDARPEDFVTIDDIPQQSRRDDRWRLDYRRQPYLRALTEEQLRDHYDEVMVVVMTGTIKDCPIRASKQTMREGFERFAHLTQEMAQRAIPAPTFRMEPQRLAKAARRLGLPEEVVSWFANGMAKSNE